MISSGPVSMSDWMLLSMSQMGGQTKANRVAETLVQKLLEIGDIHTSAAILLGLGDKNDAVEVYVSRHHYLEAILLTCLLMPTDWQRQSYLVRRWGEHVVSHSQQQLAIRCFMCTGVEPSEPWASPAAQQAASFAEMMSRRSPMTSPEPSYSDSASVMPSNPQPQPGPGGRGTAKTPALKLITSFDNEPKQRFQFPGLKSDDRTPTNVPGVTPIAESAVGESALSPGGLGSYQLNNIESLNRAMGSRSNTPAHRRRRLPSIGETPVDVNPPAFPSKSAQGTAVTSDTEDSQQDEKNNQQVDDPLALLPSVRYDPDSKHSPQTAVKPSPQTAVHGNSDQFAGIKGPPSPAPGVFEAVKECSHSRSSSGDKKPDVLQIHLLQTDAPQTSGQEEADTASSARSAASTLNTARSPSASGKSIDQYISSVGEANFRARMHRDRPPARSRRDDAPSQSSRRHRPRNASREDRGRNENKHIPPPERSPSGPHQVTSEDAPRYNTTTPNQDETSKTKHHASKAESSSGARKPRSRKSSERRNNRSTSRNTGSRSGYGNDHSTRDRSKDRQGSRVRTQSSPQPISPDGGGNPQRPEDVEDALRLVTVDRERLRSNPRSASGHSENGEVPRAGASPEPKRMGAKSRSRQKPEPGSTAGQAPYQPTHAADGIRQDGRAEDPSTMSAEEAQSPLSAKVPLVGLAERRRKELAAAELEARRRSLARNPSAPNIPFPGQTPRAPSPIASRPFAISSPEQAGKITPSKASPEYPSSSDSSSSRAGVPIGLPATPRAMRHPKYSNGYEEEIPPVPQIPDGSVFTNDARHQVEETIGRSMSVPAPETQPSVPAGLPMHPMYNPRLPSSRSTSRDRNAGHHRKNSRELNGSGDHGLGSSPVTVNIEGGIEGATQKKLEHPPILPELQHLNTPPPPPPAPIPTGSPRESSGTIDIAIDNENMGRLPPRAMTAGAAPTAEPRPNPGERRRMSFDHRRNRSTNESFGNKIWNLARKHSYSRGMGRPNESESPYESVQMIESQI